LAEIQPLALVATALISGLQLVDEGSRKGARPAEW
jgi:hypothetical protein